MKFNVYLNTLRLKGYLAYEYNPFHNYQTDVKLYKYENYIFPQGTALNPKNGDILVEKDSKWVDSRGRIIEDVITEESAIEFAEPGSLIDFDTNQLNFDLDHPVDITVLPSYDGSVNLILNDDKNIPRLINSRFSVREKNTYEIVDRIGENDTNVYNSRTFDKDTSLYFLYEDNPTINYLGFVKGILPVGSYCFYFTYCDADDNESDYIAESGIIPVFIGSDSDPNSMDGGIKNQNSNKGIKLKLSNLDKSYNYLKVTYVRFFADYLLNRVHECKKIYKRYPINSNTIYLQITGNEESELLDANILNITRFNPKSVLTQALCKNMLFFGNIVKNSDNYRELLDCALRIIPSIVGDTIDTVDNSYLSGKGYYNSINMYNKVGYHSNEYYRFGVVFIYLNGTLSNVYNTLGGDILGRDIQKDFEISIIDNELFDTEGYLLVRKYIKIDDNGWIAPSLFSKGTNLNAKGVCKLTSNEKIFGVRFSIPNNVIKFLKEDLGIRGLFFVRQKCVPNTLAQCLILPMDEELEAPVIKSDGKYYTECFLNLDTGRLVSTNYSSRLYNYEHTGDSFNAISKHAYAGICPDFLLNLPYYNQIFNGAKFRLEKVNEGDLTKNDRFYNYKGESKSNQTINTVTICSVTEEVPTVALKNKTFRLEIGETEEVFRFRYAEVDKSEYKAGDDNTEDVKNATNLVRGKYSPYLAIYSDTPLTENAIYNIYSEISANETLEYQNRMDSSEPFYAISDRYNFENLTLHENNKIIDCWRGDCFLNQFTYRLNRNFNDPSLPNNDEIIDEKTWRENYDPINSEKWADISRSDINAVQLGSWITFQVKSFFNYALRSVDHSYVSEEALMGTPRSFYPKSHLLWRGENKLPDSYLYNDAFRTTVGFKCYFTLQDINYIKNTFSNRILYSAVSIQDSFKNNYRYSLSTYFRDYSLEYGSILRLIGFEGYLLVVFEHAIGIAVINERVLAGSGDGEPVFINTQNVLPEELTIITDTYGSQWPESIIKSEAGYVYGVDTIAKKIWRVKGQELEILSDFKVNKFLIDNISLGERELYPIIGLKNVKTHYNNNKKDVMFTFYDDVYRDEEKVWNLCYNELLGTFVTFYSWIPSYSENIDTQFFTFNRDTSKGLALLNKCSYSIPENHGVLVDSPILDDEKLSFNLYYSCVDVDAQTTYTVKNEDGTTSLRTVKIDGTPDNNGHYLANVKFKIEKDHWQNYNLIENEKDKGQCIIKNDSYNKLLDALKEQGNILLLYVTPYNEINGVHYPTEVIALTLKSIINNLMLKEEELNSPNLTTDFYLHGLAGIFDITENTYPTHWYGKYHPFEFEFIVNDKIGLLKVFENLVIISNKAEPESFHFEIEGDNYEFSEDKRNMYFRLEATKELYLNLGSNMLYDRYYTDVATNPYTYELHPRNYKEYNKGMHYPHHDNEGEYEPTNLALLIKSSIFPLHYEKVDTFNDIYYIYRMMLDKNNNYDFKNLSGSEIKWYRDLNLFNIVTHIKNSPIDLYGVLRGNSRYKEGKWNILIPSIIFNLKNESPDWKVPPIVINSLNLPNDLTTTTISEDKIPNIYTGTKNSDINNYIQQGDWTARKEARIRDKWIKIRIRYSGRNLAVIHSIITLYNISYS